MKNIGKNTTEHPPYGTFVSKSSNVETSILCFL